QGQGTVRPHRAVQDRAGKDRRRSEKTTATQTAQTLTCTAGIASVISSGARARASRDCQRCPGAPPRFRSGCCFPVIYFVGNISFVPAATPDRKPRMETPRLIHAVNTAWAESTPNRRFGSGSGEIDVVWDCAGTGSHHRGGTCAIGAGRGAAGYGGLPRRLFAGNDRGENQRTAALSGGRSGPRRPLSGRRRQGRQAVGRRDTDCRQIPQPGVVAAG